MAALEEVPAFDVVTKAGRVVMSARLGLTQFYDADGEPVATIRTRRDGTYFMARSPAYGLSAALGATERAAGLRVRDGGLLRIDAGRQEAGNIAMRFINVAGNLAAGIGESRAGSGVVRVGDHGGFVRAWMTADSGGAISVLDGKTTIATLSEGATRGGLLTLSSAADEPVVKMGVADDRYGIVLTGPAAGLPLVPATGLPGSYIMGNAGK